MSHRSTLDARSSSSAPSPTWRRGRRRLVLLAVVLCAVAFVAPGATAPAGAFSSDLLYSVDGGATWSSSVTVAPGDTVLVRQWFDNDEPLALPNTSAITDIPDRFTRTSDPTRVCLNPSTTDPSAPDDSELRCSAVDDSAVWSGDHLTVAPSAGAFGIPTDATVGPLAAGRTRYLTMNQATRRRPCPLQQGSVTGFIPIPFNGEPTISAGLDAGNSPGSVSWSMIGCSLDEPADSANATAFDLLGNRYLNIHQCQWSAANGDSVGAIVRPEPMWGQFDPVWGTGSNTSETADSGTPTCGTGGSGYSYEATTSGVLALDVLYGRYLQMEQCRWQSIDSPTTWVTSVIHNANPFPDAGGTFTYVYDPSSLPVGCANPDPASYVPDTTVGADFEGAASVDLWDATRGRTYVEYTIVADATPTAAGCVAGQETSEQESRLEDFGFTDPTPPGFVLATSAGSLTIDWTLAPELCPVDPIPLVDPTLGAFVVVLGAGAWLAVRRVRPARVA